jgi:hypothetical protein
MDSKVGGENLQNRATRKTAMWEAAFMGFPLGVTFGEMLTLAFSLVYCDDRLHPVAPIMLEWMPSELAAGFSQTILFGILGSLYIAINHHFCSARWSLLKCIGVHLMKLSLVIMPIFMVSSWFRLLAMNTWAAIALISFSGVIYIGIRILIYSYRWHWIKEANRRLQARRHRKRI